MVTMICNIIKGCNKRHNEFFKSNSGFGKYKERKGEIRGGKLEPWFRARQKNT
jgi:hypothetical protein